MNNITFESTMTPGQVKNVPQLFFPSVKSFDYLLEVNYFCAQDSNNVFVNKEYSKLEPLGFFFVITFIFIMIIQVVTFSVIVGFDWSKIIRFET